MAAFSPSRIQVTTAITARVVQSAFGVWEHVRTFKYFMAIRSWPGAMTMAIYRRTKLTYIEVTAATAVQGETRGETWLKSLAKTHESIPTSGFGPWLCPSIFRPER